MAPTTHLFAERVIRAMPGAPQKLEFLLAYLCELALLSDKITLRYVDIITIQIQLFSDN